ncbi:hypothetical protein [uncultured Dubosiella sp.]|uniref:hypothetical protein n=1 Tax=uncultured Dubosiella sp. TaxID=1937011 RepID=UPI0025964AF4|nr:hypothetical protein [uncultured Dubosiella sp.]
MMKKKTGWLISLAMIVFLTAYVADGKKRNENPVPDLPGTFQQADFPKDFLTFYAQEDAYEYISQSEYTTTGGRYTVEGTTIVFEDGPLARQEATIERDVLTLGNVVFHKVSQLPTQIGYE